METIEKSQQGNPVQNWMHMQPMFSMRFVWNPVIAHNRPNGCLNKLGYANLMAQFNERMGRNIAFNMLH
jgi:hypothetical protein